nr:anti-sigma factor domain-containing protein [Halobacillus locisalis]
MEQKRKYTIVMTSDGRFHRADRLEAAEVGMEVQFNVAEENRNLFGWTQILRDNRMKIAIATIVFLVTLLPVFSWYGSNQAYAYVNLDINPSFEMELNDKMQVIAMNPQNEEAEDILALLEDWKRQDASEVTLQTIRISKQQGYVNQEEQVLVGISYVKSDQEQNSFPKEIETYLTGESAGMSIAAFYVPSSIRNEAKDSGKSVNAVMAEYLTASSSETKRAREPMTVDDTDQEIIRSFYNKDTRQVADSDPDEKEQNTKSLPNSPKPVNGEKDLEEPQFSNGQKNNSIKNGTIKKDNKGNPKPAQEDKDKQKDRPAKKEKKNERDEMERQERKEQQEKEKRMKKERKEEKKQERKEEKKEKKDQHHKEKGEKNKKPPKEKKNE